MSSRIERILKLVERNDSSALEKSNENISTLKTVTQTLEANCTSTNQANIVNSSDTGTVSYGEKASPIDPIKRTFNSYDETDAEEEPCDDSDKDPDYLPSDDGGENENPNDCLSNNDEHEIIGYVDLHTEEVEVGVEKNARTRKMSKKRIRNVEEWKATKRTKLTLSGMEHTSKSGNIIKQKILKVACKPCRKKCTQKISENCRTDIFNAYWNASKSWDLKRQFIISHVKTKPICRIRPKDGSKGNQRKMTFTYDFEINGEKVEVCKVFFLNTLGISETVIRNALKKREIGGFIAADKRGRHIPSNKLSENVVNRIRSHIKSFPVCDSHYSREKTGKSFLSSDLNQKKMYQLYLEKCEEEGLPQKEIAKIWAYRHIFETEFNLTFKVPSSDTCDKCDNFTLRLKEANIDEEEKILLQQEYDNHLQDAGDRYTEKKDKSDSRINRKTKVVMLDLQKCLPTPYLSNAQSFYSLKLWTFNLTIYDATEKKSYCVVWDESQVGRGGHEIASALIKWASIVISNSDIETLIIWSDNCPSQNRNIMVMTSYFWLLKICPNLKTVIHKYLLRGHTHMEADHVHALIEKNVKKKPTMQIITPWDWQQLIRSSGATVIDIKLEDFKNLDILYSQPQSPFIQKKQNTQREPFLISLAVCLEARAEYFGTVYYKTDFTEPYKSINMSRSPRKNITLPMELPVARDSPKGITQNKYNHLMNLLQWIQSQFHSFFKDIPIQHKQTMTK